MKTTVKCCLAISLLCGTAIVSMSAARSLRMNESRIDAAAQAAPVPALSPYIDTHVHSDGGAPAVVRAALQALSRQNAAKLFFMPPPDTFDTPNRLESDFLLPAVRQHSGSLAILAGGGTLNAIIQQSVKSGNSGAAVQARFRDRAEEIVRIGGIGFGELTAEHFVSDTPYQYAPSDHPLFLLLADIAADRNAPIVIHMEAAPADMAAPPRLGPRNPKRIRGNVAAFERLLAHNRAARIVWAHFGSDSLGFRTPQMVRRLLRANPNLYMEIKTDPLNRRSNYPLDANGKLKPDYLKLFSDFPGRFVIGSDQHYPEPRASMQRWQAAVNLLNQLPSDVRAKIGEENIAQIYPLNVRPVN